MNFSSRPQVKLVLTLIVVLSTSLFLFVHASSSAQATHASSTNSLVPQTGTVSSLHVSGNKLVNAQGQQIILRGVNRSGTEYACIQGWGIFDGPNLLNDDASIPTMKSWGINAVNIGLNEDCWLGINGVTSQYGGINYQQALVHYIQTIENNGMYPVLSLFWSAPGTNQATAQSSMPDADHSTAMWQSVANTFKNDTAVIFRLKEEPYPNGNSDDTAAWQCWRDGGSSCNEGYSVVGMQSLIDTIRATGATNVIQVPGVQYANAMTQFLTYKPTDSLNDLMAVVDVYPDLNPCGNTTCYNNVYAPIIAQMPFIAGEFGESVNGDICSVTNSNILMNWLDQHNSGYLAWVWDTWGTSCGDLSLITDYNGTPHSPNGSNYKAHLLALVGNPMPTSQDPSPTPTPTAKPSPTSTFTPTPTPTPQDPSPTPTPTAKPSPTSTFTPTPTPTPQDPSPTPTPTFTPTPTQTLATAARGKLFILLQGINSQLLQPQVNQTPGFGTIAPVLQKSFPGAQLVSYSYNGLVTSGNNAGQLQPYDCRATFTHSIMDDVMSLNAEIMQHPNTDIYLIGHSLGGVVAYSYLTALTEKVAGVSLPANSQLKALVTLDAPIGGVPDGDYFTLANVLFAQGIPSYHQAPFCAGLDGQHLSSLFDLSNVGASASLPFAKRGYAQGANASILEAIFRGTDLTNENLAAQAKQRLGTAILSIGNTNDFLWNPRPCLTTLNPVLSTYLHVPNFSTTQWLKDKGNNSGIYGRRFTAGSRLCSATSFNQLNHLLILDDPRVITGLTNFLTPIVGG